MLNFFCLHSVFGFLLLALGFSVLRLDLASVRLVLATNLRCNLKVCLNCSGQFPDQITFQLHLSLDNLLFKWMDLGLLLCFNKLFTCIHLPSIGFSGFRNCVYLHISYSSSVKRYIALWCIYWRNTGSFWSVALSKWQFVVLKHIRRPLTVVAQTDSADPLQPVPAQ